MILYPYGRGPRRVIEGSIERGPFGTKRQGEIVIVGRRPPTPPITIGRAPVILGPRPLPPPIPPSGSAPRPAPPERPAPVVIPRPPSVEIPRPDLPGGVVISPPSPVQSGAPAPKAVPWPISTPTPGPQGSPAKTSKPTTGSAPRPASLSTPMWSALLSSLLGRRRRSTRFTDPLTQPFADTAVGSLTPGATLVTPSAPAVAGPSASPTPSASAPFASPSSLTGTLTSSGAPPFSRTATRTRECHCRKCNDKPRKKPRKCFARGQLVWASGPKKGKPAGSRCIKF